MFRSIKLLAGIGLLTAGSAAGATTVTFGGFAGGVTSYSALGVTITANGQIIDAATTPNGTNGILADGAPRSTFTAVFDVLTNSVSVDLGDFGVDADDIFLQAFGVGDVPLGEISLLLSTTDTSMHTLTINASGISSVVFGSRDPSINGSSVYADNLTFQTPVPEPSSWGLMLVGFAAIGWRVRRRERKRALLG